VYKAVGLTRRDFALKGSILMIVNNENNRLAEDMFPRMGSQCFNSKSPGSAAGSSIGKHVKGAF
jgi:hypothetical protein